MSRLRRTHVSEDRRNLPTEEVAQASVLVNFVVAGPTAASVSGASNDDRNGEDEEDRWDLGKEEGTEKKDPENRWDQADRQPSPVGDQNDGTLGGAGGVLRGPRHPDP